MTAAPAFAPTWSGQFDVPARFDTDQLDITVLDTDLNAQAGRIPIVEIRV